MSVKTYIDGYDWLGTGFDDFFVKKAIEAGRPVQQITKHRYKGRDENGKLKISSKYTALYAPSEKPAPQSVVFAWTLEPDGVTRTVRGFFGHIDEADDFLCENGHFGCEESGVSEASLPHTDLKRMTFAV